MHLPLRHSSFLVRHFLALLLLAPCSLLHAQARPEIISPEVKRAVDKAIGWLTKQQKDDGYFSEDKANTKVKRGEVPSHSGAMTALSLMGLASVGHTPTDATPEGKAAARGLKFILDNIEPDENGYLGRSDRSRMYGHGIMTLMLTEMLGMAPDEKTDKQLHKVIDGAIQLIIRAQQVPKSEANRGGWRYEPSSSDSDISVSVWQVMALRAAKNAGFNVPKESIDNAVAYIKRSYRVERDSNGQPKTNEAAFSYEPYGGRQTFSTTAAGLLSLQVCGQYETPEVVGSSNYQLKFPQAKLVSVAHGRIYDVVVDCRRGSSAFGQWIGIELSAEGGEEPDGRPASQEDVSSASADRGPAAAHRPWAPGSATARGPSSGPPAPSRRVRSA